MEENYPTPEEIQRLRRYLDEEDEDVAGNKEATGLVSTQSKAPAAQAPTTFNIYEPVNLAYEAWQKQNNREINPQELYAFIRHTQPIHITDKGV